MNGIATFRLCTLSDKELFRKAEKLVDEMYTTGKLPSRHIPARPNEDFDLVMGELLIRFLEAKNIDLKEN